MQMFTRVCVVFDRMPKDNECRINIYVSMRTKLNKDILISMQ